MSITINMDTVQRRFGLAKILFRLFFLWVFFLPLLLPAQSSQPPRLLSLQWADTLHRPRVRAAAIGAGITYPVAMIGLWKAWYADYPIGKFHFFNDMGEWNQMDKLGHWYSGYQEARLGWHLARWSGIPNRRASWMGFGLGQLVQSSFEVMDGFSDQWGFSVGDIAFNTLGTSLFTAQQLSWQEQRITMKISSMPVHFDGPPVAPVRGIGPPVSLQNRANDLYGTGAVSQFLKNYNASVMWVSVNPRSFSKETTWLPRWLNIAAGMGSDNMFAGYGYEWQADKNCTGPDCAVYSVDPRDYPRTRQWFLSFDIDFTRLGVKNRVLRTLLSTVNIFKFPAPALEWTDRGRFHFHPIYF